MNTILIATTNPGKLHEIKLYLTDLPVELVDLVNVEITQGVKEDGKTFEENAIKKAQFYHSIAKLPTIADDGGFEIDALGGEPGVLSHRWVDPSKESSDEELIEYTMKRLEGVPLERRGARLRVVVAFVSVNGEVSLGTASVRGIVPFQPSSHRTPGFPYRSLLYLPQISKFYDHGLLSPSENQLYNHRTHALEQIKPKIKEALCLT